MALTDADRAQLDAIAAAAPPITPEQLAVLRSVLSVDWDAVAAKDAA